MICIAIAQESRRLALADMLNAAPQCDLLEIRLDRFDKAPDVGELLAHKPRPTIFSCRRRQDGGDWKGTEEERLALLRQCIVSKADYVEIELDVADQIRKFPPAKRVISYTNLQETPANIAEIYAQAQTKSPDVIKLVTLVRAPEEAWPLLQVMARPALPTVAIGLGPAGIMLSVLGKKLEAPWTYAALEKGMEAYPGQPTVRELNDIYHYGAIGRSTRLIGVTGFGRREQATVAALNAAFAHLDLKARCLPLALGSVSIFRKVMDAVHMGGVVVDEGHREAIVSIAAQLEPAAAEARAADVLLPRDKTWQGHSTVRQATLAALEAALGGGTGPSPLAGRHVLVVGVNGAARALAYGIKERGAAVIIASHDREAAHQLATVLECRHVQFEALYTTMHEILVVGDHELEHGKGKGRTEGGVHPGYLRPGMTVLDASPSAEKLPLLREAEARGCRVVSPRLLLRSQLALQAQLITGKAVPGEVLDGPLAAVLDEGV
jgi:3-dehydroquinate dehydratase/shikimate dehydrogenase